MSDAAELAWDGGADLAAARLIGELSRRFSAAVRPDGDLGATSEEHEAAVASCVYAVHMDINSHGEEVYSEVWRTLDAPTRRAIKAYVSMHK